MRVVRLNRPLGGVGSQLDSWSGPGEVACTRMSSDPSALNLNGMDESMP